MDLGGLGDTLFAGLSPEELAQLENHSVTLYDRESGTLYQKGVQLYSLEGEPLPDDVWVSTQVGELPAVNTLSLPGTLGELLVEAYGHSWYYYRSSPWETVMDSALPVRLLLDDGNFTRRWTDHLSLGGGSARPAGAGPYAGCYGGRARCGGAACSGHAWGGGPAGRCAGEAGRQRTDGAGCAGHPSRRRLYPGCRSGASGAGDGVHWGLHREGGAKPEREGHGNRCAARHHASGGGDGRAPRGALRPGGAGRARRFRRGPLRPVPAGYPPGAWV